MLKIILIIAAVLVGVWLVNDLIQLQMEYSKRRRELHEKSKEGKDKRS